MSEHKGPWMRPNGNLIHPHIAGYREASPRGQHVCTHFTVPNDCIPLVPQTEVDAVKAQLEEARAPWVSPIGSRERWAGENPEPIPFPREYNDLYRIKADYMRAIECSSSGPTPEERSEKVDAVFRASMDLTYEVTHLRAELTAAQSEVARLKEAGRKLIPAYGGTPSLPAVDVNNPDQAKFVADWFGGLTSSRLGIDPDGRFNLFGFWEKLKEYSIRIRLEQAEKAKRDSLIEQAAEVLYITDIPAGPCRAWEDVNDVGREPYYEAARALLDRFDITPKAVES